MSKIVYANQLAISSEHPVRLQSMTNTPTRDIEATKAQAIRLIEAGAELVRITTQNIPEVHALAKIKVDLHLMGYDTPIIADVHFSPQVARMAASICDKVRINPGNFLTHQDLVTEEDEIEALMKHLSVLTDICRRRKAAIRIGINHGSLSPNIIEQYGDSPEGMVASAENYLRIMKKLKFENLVLSMKASNVAVMLESTRMLHRRLQELGTPYPLHLGVTEAGQGLDARIKSAIGIGTLLRENIGETIRVSLTEDPENELPAARFIRDYAKTKVEPPQIIDFSTDHTATWIREDRTSGRLLVKQYSSNLKEEELAMAAAIDMGDLLLKRAADGLLITTDDGKKHSDLALLILQATRLRMSKTEYISCPSCGRTLFDIQKTALEIQAKTSHLKNLKIAVMGCIVNGPGEMADADYGYVGSGVGRITLYKGKTVVKRNIPQENALDELIALIKENNDWKNP